MVFLFGLNKAGKSTIVEFFREKRFLPQTPTLGVSITQLVFSELVVEFTDVGGQEAFRKDWTTYLKKPHVLLFVIDGLDRDPARIRDASAELRRILQEPSVTGVPLLVLINKMDDPLAMSRKIVDEKYNLGTIAGRDVTIYEVSAKSGERMEAALNALTSMVLKDDAIEYFVNAQVKQQAKQLAASYKDFVARGQDALKDKRYEEALASFNLAKEISSNLFQLGVLSSGKEYQKLASAIAKAEQALDEQEARERQGPKQSYLAALREGTGTDRGDAAIKRVSIFLFGLDRAGKTTFVEFLKNEKFKNQTPTLGINVSHLVLGNVRFEFNDLGGQAAFRPAWMDSWTGQDLLVFMVDASDAPRFGEARDALWSIIGDRRTMGKPLLVLANKIDLPEARPRVVVEAALQYHDIDRPSKQVYEISVQSNYNLDKALNHVVSLILQDHEMGKFVSREIKRLVKNYKEMFSAFTAEAKHLEKRRDHAAAYDRVYKARMVMEELFKHGDGKAQREIKKCDAWLARLAR